MKCRSIRYTSKEQVELIDIDVPDPAPGEVQIQSLACGVCAWDLHVFRNGVDWPTPPGHEGIGRIVKLGHGVSNLKEGDCVTGHCLGFGEFYNRPVNELYCIPATMRNPAHWVVEPVA